MSVESATVSKDVEQNEEVDSVKTDKCAVAFSSISLTNQQKEHLLKQLQQLRHDLDAKFMLGPTALNASAPEDVEEKSDHEKLGITFKLKRKNY